jgi:hypothetical protein
VNMLKRLRAVTRPSFSGGTDMIVAFCACGPQFGPLPAQF